MKCILFCCHHSGLHLAQQMIEKEVIIGIVVPAKVPEFHQSVSFLAKMSNIDFKIASSEELGGELLEWLKEKSPDVCIVNTFSYLLPKAVIDVPRYGTWNFHGGKLPEFRGPFPVFWQMRQGVDELTMTLHQMNEVYDAGGIFQETKLRIGDWDTHDVALNRLSQNAPKMLDDLLDVLEHGDPVLTQQDESHASFQKKPTMDDVLIQWESMSAAEICNLVRACNLSAGGAVTFFRSMELRFYEVEAIPLTDPPDAKPGTIATIENDPHLYVLCIDSSVLRVNVLGMTEVVSSGANFKRILDVKSGQCFTSKME